MESLRKRFVDKYGMDAVDLLDKVNLAYPEHINSKTLTFDFRLEQYFEKQGIENIEVNEPFYIDFVQALTEADVYLGRNEVPVFDIFEVDVPFKVYKPKSSKGTLEDFKPIVGNDGFRPAINGVYVDNGRLVATDTHVLITYTPFERNKTNEFSQYDGKIINLDTYIKTKGRSITFINEKYPDYEAVIPKKENQKVIKDVNVLSLLNYLTGVKALRKNIYNNIFQVVIQFDKETIIAFQSDFLYDVLNFIVQKGYEVVDIGYQEPNRAIKIYYPKGVALVMPVMIYSEEGTSSGSKKISLETILDEYSSENQMVKTKEKVKKINEKIDVVQEWQDTIATLQELLNEEGVSAQDKEEWEMTIATLEELLKEQKMELGGLVMSYSSPQIVEGIGSFTSQFDGGGVTRKVSKYSILEPNYGENKYTIWNSTYGDIMYGFKTREEAQDYIDNVLTKGKYAEGGEVSGYVDLSKQKGMVVNDSGKLKELPIIDIVKKNTITTYPKVINGASVVYDMMKDLYGDSIRSYESFYAIMLDKANKPIYIYEHSKGGLDATIGDVQLIMATANKTLAKGIVLVHNHPSGNLTASEQDKILTKKVGNACKFFGIVLLDHLIITENGYTSFAEEGIDLAKDGIKVQDGESAEDNLSYAEAQERWNKKAGIPSQQDAIKFVKDNPEILMALEDGGKVFDPNQYELRLEDGDIIKEGKSFKDAFNDMIRLGIFDDKSKKKTNREKIEEAKNKLKAKN